MNALEEVAVGAVVRNGKLITVVRTATRFQEPRVEPVETPGQAATALNRLKYELRRTLSCEPVVHLASGHVAGQVIVLLQEHDRMSADQLIEGAAPSGACAPGGAEYANRHAEIADTFLAELHAGKVLLAPDNALSTELLAFERGESNGKISYPSPADVEKTIGYYPVRAVATLLASIPAPPPGSAPSKRSEHDPYANIGGR